MLERGRVCTRDHIYVRERERVCTRDHVYVREREFVLVIIFMFERERESLCSLSQARTRNIPLTILYVDVDPRYDTEATN